VGYGIFGGEGDDLLKSIDNFFALQFAIGCSQVTPKFWTFVPFIQTLSGYRSWPLVFPAGLQRFASTALWQCRCSLVEINPVQSINEKLIDVKTFFSHWDEFCKVI